MLFGQLCSHIRLVDAVEDVEGGGVRSQEGGGSRERTCFTNSAYRSHDNTTSNTMRQEVSRRSKVID